MSIISFFSCRNTFVRMKAYYRLLLIFLFLFRKCQLNIWLFVYFVVISPLRFASNIFCVSIHIYMLLLHYTYRTRLISLLPNARVVSIETLEIAVHSNLRVRILPSRMHACRPTTIEARGEHCRWFNKVIAIVFFEAAAYRYSHRSRVVSKIVRDTAIPVTRVTIIWNN